MPFVWVTAPPRLVTTITEKLEGMEAEVRALLQEAGVSADLEVRKIITESVTPTGEARAAAGGGSAGRIETKDMRDSVKYRVTGRGVEIVLEYGWLLDHELYFLYQEFGTSTIEGMNALFKTQQITVLEVALGLAAIVRGR